MYSCNLEIVVRKPTKFEEKIGYTFKKTKLRSAILHHKSLVSDTNAYQKWGYYQHDLAYDGDAIYRLVLTRYMQSKEFAIVSHSIPIKKYTEIRNILQSNEFMQFVVNRHKILNFLKTNRGLKQGNTSQMIHPCGTFIEAIIAAIFIDSGDSFDECYNYFSRIISPYITEYFLIFIEQNRNPLEVCIYLPALLAIVSSQKYKLSFGIRKQQKKIIKDGLVEGYVSFHFKIDNNPVHLHKAFLAKDKFNAIDGAALTALNQLKELRVDLF
jgi:dsRNA-specific ribonuclease